MAKVVLVTGVARYLGARFARTISADPSIDRVIGVDVVAPHHDLGACEFIRADIRNPVIAKIIDRGAVDTVVHLSVIATPTAAAGRGSMKEINVIGTMQLLAACHRSTTVRRFVMKSTASVYGASSKDPARFTEDDAAGRLPRSGWGRDCVEVEGYVRGFSRRRPDVDIAVLRLANVLGPGVTTEVTEYFRQPVPISVLGFDPRLQFVHEDDLVEALRLATVGSVTGTVNVAGDGVMSLSQALGRLGRPSLPVPRGRLETAARAVGKLVGAQVGPDLMLLLTYGRALDTTRMRADLGLEPRFTTEQTFEAMAQALAVQPMLAEHTLDGGIARVVDTVGKVESVGRAFLAGFGSPGATR